MRVVAGELRGRRIDAPEGTKTRPTTDKAREATFNALGSLGVVVGARMVDAFAGSGALGIEALSRGAAHCTFIERDRDALEVLRGNLATLGLEDRSTVVRGDVMSNIGLVRGIIKSSSRSYFMDVISEFTELGIEGVIAGCTEIELLVRPEELGVAYFPTTSLHSAAAAEFALS